MSAESTGGERKPESKGRVVIPPFLKPEAYVKREERRVRGERRLRVRRSKNVDEGKAMINPDVAKELGIRDKVELVLVGGGSRERRYVLDAVLNSNVPTGEVWCNEDDMRKLGIADNSMATVRAPREAG